MVIQDGGRYPSLIRDVIVRLALVYFIACLSLFSALRKFLFYRVFKFIFCSAQVFILACF